MKCQECNREDSSVRWSQVTRSESCDNCHLETMAIASSIKPNKIQRVGHMSLIDATQALVDGLKLPNLPYKHINVDLSISGGVVVKAEFHLNE